MRCVFMPALFMPLVVNAMLQQAALLVKMWVMA